MVENFVVQRDGKIYECSRTIAGSRSLRQTVRVNGFGTKTDPAEYGNNGHRIESMPMTARLIAHELIQGI